MCRPCTEELEGRFKFRGRQWVSFRQRCGVALPVHSWEEWLKEEWQGWWQGARWPGGLEQVTGLEQGRGQEAETRSEWHAFWSEKLRIG